MKILCNRLDRGFYQYQEEFEKKALDVLRSGWYVLGQELECFEKEFADFLGSRYCAGVASGLDALRIAVHLLGIGEGDEVIAPANTYIASIMGITMNGALPILVEPDEYFNLNPDLIEEKITKRTKAILVVHLYGQPARMAQIMDIAKHYHLRVIEDCAQSHGAAFDGKMTGTFGDIGCFSFYPTKNLGCFGDGGAIVTDNEELIRHARSYRNYGSEKKYHNCEVGLNSRLDEIQAGLLRVRLKHMQELIEERRNICRCYQQRIQNSEIILPKVCKKSSHVWHQFVIRTNKRKELVDFLEKKKIQTMIHYPVPPHKSQAYSAWNNKVYPLTEKYAEEVLSLPLYNGMTMEEVDYVIRSVNEYEI